MHFITGFFSLFDQVLNNLLSYTAQFLKAEWESFGRVVNIYRTPGSMPEDDEIFFANSMFFPDCYYSKKLTKTLFEKVVQENP